MKKQVRAASRTTLLLAIVIELVIVGFLCWNIYDSQPAPMIEQFGPSTPNVPIPASFVLQASDLEYFTHLGGTEALAESTISRLPKYDRLVRNLGDLHRYDFDVVLQEHDVVGNDSKGINRVRHSQRRVFATLDDVPADVVMVEGVPLDRITTGSLKAWAIESASRQGQVLSPVMYDRGFKESLPFDGTMRYLINRPDATMSGAEDEALNLFHEKVLYILDNAYMNDAERDSFATLGVQLRVARSIVAVCRSVEALKRFNGQRATIVIGYAHAPEVVATIRRFGGRGRIYDATK